jgi:hypothetical protein
VISVKFVDTVFRRYWAFVLPVVLVPVLVIQLTGSNSEFQSSASVWVSAPIAEGDTSLGHNNVYLTPAQNQATAMGDLLATASFREKVAVGAGVVDSSASQRAIRMAAQKMVVWPGVHGVNLLTLTARAGDPETAQRIVGAVISEYQKRAASKIVSDASIASAYYEQQLAASKETLADRKAELTEYLRANPKAADPTNAASRDLDYLTLIERVNAQTTVVEELERAEEGVKMRGAAAPQTQEAAFSVQDAPSLPTAPVAASLTEKVGYPFAGLMFGLLIGSAYIYLTYRTDHTIRTAADLASMPVALLGSVPDLKPGPAWMRSGPLSWMFAWKRRDFARRTAASISAGLPGAARKEA